MFVKSLQFELSARLGYNSRPRLFGMVSNKREIHTFVHVGVLAS